MSYPETAPWPRATLHDSLIDVLEAETIFRADGLDGETTTRRE